MRAIVLMFGLVTQPLSLARVFGDDGASEHVAWSVAWPRGPEFSEDFVRGIEMQVDRILRSAGRGALWTPLSEEARASMSVDLGGEIDWRALLSQDAAAFDQVVVVGGARKAERWVLEARSVAAWLPPDPRTQRTSVTRAALLPVALARLIRDTHVPMLRVTQIQNDRVQIAAATRPASGEWLRVLLRGDQSSGSGGRLLQHAFVQLSSGGENDRTLSGELHAIASDVEAIIQALAEKEQVVLAPLNALPGRVRLRVLDGESGAPAENVEVYASQTGPTTAAEASKGVTRSDGRVEFSDPDGRLWFIVLKSGTRVSQVPLVCAGLADVVDLPIMTGRDSHNRSELNRLIKDLNENTKWTQGCLGKGDEALGQGRFDEARRHYEQARNACWDPSATEQRFARIVDAGRGANTAQEDADELRAVDLEKKTALSALQTQRTNIQKRLQVTNETQELSDRVARSEELASKAKSRCDDDLEIDDALRLYDEAIALVADAEPKYREPLLRQRNDIAKRWSIRGGERHKNARQFVFVEMARAGAMEYLQISSQLGDHIDCLIANVDVYSLLKFTRSFKERNEEINVAIAAVREASEQGKFEEAEKLKNALQGLGDARRRVDEAWKKWGFKAADSAP